MKYLLSILLLLSCLSVHAADQIAADGTWAGVSNALFLASAGDFVSIPASSNEWAGELLVNKQVTIRGASSNVVGGTIIKINGAGVQTPLFHCTAQWCVFSNLYLRGQNTGSDYTGYCLLLSADNCIARNCYFTICFTPVVMESFSLMYNCVVVDCRRMGRCYGEAGNASTWPGLGLTNGFGSTTNFLSNTNWSMYENNTVYQTATAAAILGQQACITSQQGQMWCARFNNITLDGFYYSPVFDSHGALGTGTINYGGFTVQAYKNTVTCINNGKVDKFFDIRGGSAIIYSNGVTTACNGEIDIRDGDSPGFFFNAGPPCTNIWTFANTTNNGANWMQVISDQPTTNLLGTTYFTNGGLWASFSTTLHAPPYPDNRRLFAEGTTPSGITTNALFTPKSNSGHRFGR